MKSSIIVSLLGLSTFSFGAVMPSMHVKRNATAVIGDIAAISSGIDGVQGAIDAFPATGGFPATLPAFQILTKSTDLNNAIQKAATDSQNSQPFTADESSQIAGAILDIQPKIDTVLNALTAKRQGFKTALIGGDASPIVVGTLNQLRSSTSSFATAVTAKLTPDFAAIAPEVAKQIDDSFQKALTAFSS